MSAENLPDSELIKILPEPALLIASDGAILSANTAFLQAISETKANLSGKKIFEISDDPADKINRYLQNCARSRQMVIGTLTLQNSKGEKIRCRCEGATFEPVREDRQAVIFLRFKPKDSSTERFILLSQKIEELNREILIRKNAEEESRKLYAEATEANRLKDEFLAVVSHELRTPLSSILGWARLLKAGELTAEQIKRAFDTIDRNARSQLQLIGDLLDVSRIITGKVRLEINPVDIVSVIESAVETMHPGAENKAIVLQVSIEPPAETIYGDAERLQQVVWNLLSNAIKFTPKEGSVRLTAKSHNAHFEIAVSDTGMGIEPEFLPSVFERFLQADMSKTRKFGGLGLGLSITRHLVELHGGTIHVFSEGVGKGAEFTIKLPLNNFNEISNSDI